MKRGSSFCVVVAAMLIACDSGESGGGVEVSSAADAAQALTDATAFDDGGRNNEGQLGRDTPGLYSDAPAPTMALPSAVLKVATGAQHTCAILNNRRVACWGNNDLGQLGTGSFDAVDGFTYVTGLP